MSRPAVRITAAPQASPADTWVSRPAAGTVAALAGLAGAISYSHMRQLAAGHGQAGWHAHAFPLSVDGLELVASLVLLDDRRCGRRSGWLPWAALMVGTAGSLAANIATARPDAVSRIIAGWPALALLIAVKLLSGILTRHANPAPLAAPVPEPARARAGSLTNGSHPAIASRPPSSISPSVTASVSGSQSPRGRPGSPASAERSPSEPTAGDLDVDRALCRQPGSSGMNWCGTEARSHETPSPPACAKTATRSATPASHSYFGHSATTRPAQQSSPQSRVTRGCP
jgi:Protein of unknown function (DUF2637)